MKKQKKNYVRIDFSTEEYEIVKTIASKEFRSAKAFCKLAVLSVARKGGNK